jgi:hypothetical protein
LRSVSRILLPPRLTVECLLRPLQACGPGYAICTRPAPDQRGYFVTKSAHGPYLATVIGDQLREIVTPVRFVPGDWYYVATTYAANDCTTTLNLYVANVTARQAALTHVGSQEVTGTYGSEAYLRIGMGALTRGAPCYAFAGSIDEVALYSDVLPIAELQRRVKILVEDPALVKDGPVTVKPFDDR